MTDSMMLNSATGRLLVLDDIFPHLHSGFRIAEVNAYLEAFPRAEVRSSALAFRGIQERRSFDEVRAEYAREFPALAPRVTSFDPGAPAEFDLAYLIFLINADFYLEYLEEHQI